MKVRRSHALEDVVLPVVANGVCDVSVTQQGANEAVGAVTGNVVVCKTDCSHIYSC